MSNLDLAYGKALGFALVALREHRPLNKDWRDALHDALQGLDRIVRRNAHPDDVSNARLAMDSLLGLWLSDDERDALAAGRQP